MENFRRNNRFGGGRDSRRSSFGDKKMYKAVCAECGKDCEVPFKPTGNKPVLCSECFRKDGNNQERRFSGRDSRRSSFGDKKMYKAVCAECGKDCEVPFKPTGNKPVLCSECFGKVSRSKGSSQSTKQLEIIEAKLDKILKLLTPVASVEKKEKKKVIKKEKAVKPKKISKAKEKKAVISKKIKTKKKK